MDFILVSFCFDREDISNTRDSVSSTMTETPRISLIARSNFSSLQPAVFGYPDQTLFLVFDILPLKFYQRSTREGRKLIKLFNIHV